MNAREKAIETMAKADYAHRGEHPLIGWENEPEWKRMIHRDHADQQLDALLSERLVVLTDSLEQVGWEMCDTAAHPESLVRVDDPDHAGRCPDCKPVYRLSDSPTPSEV